MAQKITVALEDDLDGGPAAETVRFGLGGAEYEIDLSKKNASKLRKKLSLFTEHARKAGRAQPRHAARTSSSRQRSGDIRAWAKAQGYRKRARAHPSQRCPAIPNRRPRTLTPRISHRHDLQRTDSSCHASQQPVSDATASRPTPAQPSGRR